MMRTPSFRISSFSLSFFVIFYCQCVSSDDSVCVALNSDLYCSVSSIQDFQIGASKSISSSFNSKVLQVLDNIVLDGSSIEPTRANIVSYYYGNGFSINGQGTQCFSMERAIIIFTDVIFSNCTSQNGNGGAFEMVMSTITFKNSYFENNFASGSRPNGNGGAMYFEEGTLTIENSVFGHNSAEGYGGVLYLVEGAAQLTNCSFIYNSANGSVFYASVSSRIVLYTPFFQNNAAILMRSEVVLSDDTSKFTYLSSCAFENEYDPGLDVLPSSNISCFIGNSSWFRSCSPNSHYPSQLSGNCLTCPSSSYSCCGAVSCSSDETILDICPALSSEICIVPSPAPSYLPSFSPTTVPTPIPSSSCLNGTYYDHGQCSNCPVGKSSNTDKGVSHSNCTSCVAGKYNPYEGGTCLACPSGKLSSSDRSYCSDCDAGKYSYQDTSCKSCEVGKYAPQALTDECLSCFDGAATDNVTGSASCTTCDAGKYSIIFACAYCPKGTYSVSGQSRCTNCSIGFYAHDRGSAACTACSAGKYAARPMSANCTHCAAGSYQGATGQARCEACVEGTYNPFTAASSCRFCAANFDSKAGASDCRLAIAGYYVDNFEEVWNTMKNDENGDDDDESSISVSICPSHASCEGGENMPRPNIGYWVDRSDMNYANTIYQCFRGTCHGGKVHNVISVQNRSCWSAYAYLNAYPLNTSTNNDDDVNSDVNILQLSQECELLNQFQRNSKIQSLQCSHGSGGPLCGSCDRSFVFATSTRKCISCYDANVTVVIFSVILLIGLCFLYLLKTNQFIIPEFVLNMTIFGSLSEIDNGDLRVLWSTYQIVQSVTWSLDVSFPAPFPSLLASLQIFSVDSTSITCLFPEATELINVIAISALPYLGAALIIIFFTLKDLIHSKLNRPTASFPTQESFELNEEEGEEGEEGGPGVTSKSMSATLLLGYLLIPPVCLKQLQALDCIHFPESGHSFLRIDTSVDCHSEEYRLFSIFDILLFLLSFSVPLVWFSILYQNKHSINPLPSGEDQLATWLRDQDSSLQHIRFLYHPYKPKFYFWEVLEMYRRIVFVGILPLLSPLSVRKAGAGFLLATGSIILYRETEPFNKSSTNIIAHVAQYSIMLTFATALGLEANIDQGINSLVIGGALCFLNISVVLIALMAGSQRHNIELRKRAKLLERNRTKVEWAVGFDAAKFATTFDALDRNSIPPSHALVFWYGSSMDQVSDMLKSGLPCQPLFYDHNHDHNDDDGDRRRSSGRRETESKHTGGIVFTFHQPHHLDFYDKYQFPSPIVVLAVAVPRFLLAPLPIKYIQQMKSMSNVNDSFKINADVFAHCHRTERNKRRLIKASSSSSELTLQDHPIEKNITSPTRMPIMRPNRKNIYTLQEQRIKATEKGHHAEKGSRHEDADTIHRFGHHKKNSRLRHQEQLQEGKEEKQKEEDTFKDESSLRILHSEALRALRPHFRFFGIADAKPWFKGELRFPPHNIYRAYRLAETEQHRQVPTSLHVEMDIEKVVSRRSSRIGSLNSHHFHSKPIVAPNTCKGYLEFMDAARARAEKKNWIVLYHYTQPFLAPLILKTGFRMSTQGQGDGGVFFSLRGPASYDLGSALYEDNIIIDCFGRSRLTEYKGKHMLDACILYGAEVSVLSQAPGGRDNATVFSKQVFESLSLQGEDGNYFLRPDRILGCLMLPSDDPPGGYEDVVDDMNAEKSLDLITKTKVKQSFTLGSNYEEDVHQLLQKCENRKEGISVSSSLDGSSPTISSQPPTPHHQLLLHPHLSLDSLKRRSRSLKEGIDSLVHKHLEDTKVVSSNDNVELASPHLPRSNFKSHPSSDDEIFGAVDDGDFSNSNSRRPKRSSPSSSMSRLFSERFIEDFHEVSMI